MIRTILPVGPLSCNCIILGDEASRQAVVVDPGDEAERIEKALAAHGLHVVALLHTHAHIDHMGATARLVRASGAPTYLHAADAALHRHLAEQARMLGFGAVDACPVDHFLTHGDILSFGALRLEVVHTPGHSPGSVSLVLPEAKLCLAGDTLFAGGVGRTDLWGGDTDALVSSVRERLYTLPGETEVVPGHGESTTIAREREHNPFVRDDV